MAALQRLRDLAPNLQDAAQDRSYPEVFWETWIFTRSTLDQGRNSYPPGSPLGSRTSSSIPAGSLSQTYPDTSEPLLTVNETKLPRSKAPPISGLPGRSPCAPPLELSLNVSLSNASLLSYHPPPGTIRSLDNTILCGGGKGVTPVNLRG